MGRYEKVIERVFFAHFRQGNVTFDFTRDELIQAARDLGIALPKNVGDVIYTFRYRKPLPEAIRRTAPAGYTWLIRPAGRGRYRFALVRENVIEPSAHLAVTRLPDATPGVIQRYALSDEQALLARIRYNRLVDLFTGLVCHSLQSHLRTTLSEAGQIEIDELYVGLDKDGAHYLLPVEAKSARDRIGLVQIEQDFALGDEKFPGLICIPIAAQAMGGDQIALFAFERDANGVVVSAEKHYRLVPPDELTDEELNRYRQRVRS